MKFTKVLLSIALLVMVVNAVASVRINGLGSYFEYLIQDTETDIELFPSHLGDFESKYVQIIHNGSVKYYDYFRSKNINFSLMPIASRLSYRINLDVASNNDEPRIYLNDNFRRNSTDFEGNEFGSALVSNTISYKITDSFQIGCLVNYGVNWKEIDDERIQLEDPNVTILENSEEFVYDNDYLAMGINFRFLSDYNIDILFNYSNSDIEDYVIYEENYEYTDFGNDNSTIRTDRLSDNVETESDDFGFVALLENSDDNVLSRYLLEFNYVEQLTDYSYDRSSQRSRYEDGELEYDNQYITNTIKSEMMKKYYITSGWGKTISREKLNISYGIKLHGMYCDTDRNESYYSFEYYQNVDPDTTYTDSVTVSGGYDFEINDWKVAIEVPFGASYKLNDNYQFHGGLGIKLIKQEFEYFDENEFSRWETDRYVAFGTTISPLDCLKVDVNFGYDFANFSNWQLDLKYLW